MFKVETVNHQLDSATQENCEGIKSDLEQDRILTAFSEIRKMYQNLKVSKGSVHFLCTNSKELKV